MSPLPREFHQDHDEEEQGYGDNSHTYPPVFFHVLIVRSPRVGWVVAVQDEQAIMKRSRLNAPANAVRPFGTGVPDAVSLSAAMAWLSEWEPGKITSGSVPLGDFPLPMGPNR